MIDGEFRTWVKKRLGLGGHKQMIRRHSGFVMHLGRFSARVSSLLACACCFRIFLTKKKKDILRDGGEAEVDDTEAHQQATL